MPIDFSCNHCGKKLRVPDDFAGKKAKCPQCQEVVSIPAADAPDPFAGAPSDPLGGGGEPNPFEGLGAPDTPQQSNPFEGVGASDTPQKPTPQSAQNPYSSPQASSPSPTAAAVDGPVQNVAVEFGDIFNYALEAWKPNIMPLTLAMLVVAFAPMACMLPFVILANLVEVPLLGIPGQLLGMAASLFLGVNFWQVQLKVARGLPISVGDLFKVTDKLVPGIIAAILMILMFTFGFMACIIPGFILIFMFWPVLFVVLDGKAGVMESFTVARTITKNNALTFFLVWIVGALIVLVGYIACLVGVLVTAPLAQLLWVTAYLMMSGQLANKK